MLQSGAICHTVAVGTTTAFGQWTAAPIAPLEPHAAAWLSRRLGALTPARRRSPADLELPPSRLTDQALVALRAALGEQAMRTERTARLAASAGSSYVDLLRQREGTDLNFPDAVLQPADEEQVLTALRLAGEHGLRVVARGGGTSVVGGVEPVRTDGATVVLDLRHLHGLTHLDPVDRLATFGAGTIGPDAEADLSEHGLVLGHVPQSFERATLGGYAATRSAGQSSTGYGRFDDLVVALRVATPRGMLVLGTGTPNAAGPDLRQLVLGSEGTLGVITALTVRVRPLPVATRYEGWVVPTLAEGLDVLRTLRQDGRRADSTPDVARLSDADETEVSLALRGGWTQRALQAYLRVRGRGGGCLMVLGWEAAGPTERATKVLRERRSEAVAVLRQHGALSLGTAAGEAWRRHRFAAPAQRDALMSSGVLVETVETATTWSRLQEVRTAVRTALEQSLANQGTPALVLCHVSHCYPSGASLYFTVLARRASGGTTAAITQWQAAKSAAAEAMAGSGATITHHHAVGRDHQPWLGDEIGGLGLEVLRAAQQALDPTGLCNPGVLRASQPAAHGQAMSREAPPGPRDIAVAEAEGFEPSRGFETPTRLAGGRHRPD